MNGALTERDIGCPHCGESQFIFVDTSAGSMHYIEDCGVCCQPMAISVHMDGDRLERVDVTAAQ